MDIRVDDPQVIAAVEAAVAGGKHALERQDDVRAHRKDDGYIVTEADEEAEDVIRGVLAEHSNAPIRGEERGGADDVETYWLVDPIDGTKNYARGQPTYNTSVGLIKEGTPVAGCVYVPATSEVFYAGKGLGAYYNDERITASDTTAADELYSLVDGYFPDGSNNVLRAIDGWTQRKNASALSLASIAAGWNDAAALGELKPWDMAAGFLLVNEAGGTIQTMESGDKAWADAQYGRCVATNGVESVTNDLLARLREADV